MNNGSFMNYIHNKENILSNTSDQLHLPEKTRVSKEQMIIMRRTNAKQVQQIAYQKQQQIEDLKKQFEKEKKEIISKYEKTIQEKDSYIQELEEICAGINEHPKDNQKKQQMQQLSLFKIEDQLKKYSVPNALFLHQAPLYDDICYSIQRPHLNKTQKVGDFLNNRSIKSRLMSGQKFNGSRGQGSKRSGSSSRHKLVPAPQPSFKKIL